MTDRTCLSYWFPILQKAGLPVPRTEIVRTECRLWEILDGQMPEGWKEFLAELRTAVDKIGVPAFLRTGQTSGKHRWKRTCFLTDAAKLQDHVADLIEFSALADFMGLATDVWAVREMLPTEPLCVLPAYGEFPLVKEVRCFVRGGEVVCWHNYWPEKAIYEGFLRRGRSLNSEGRSLPQNYADIVRATHDLNTKSFLPLAKRVAEAFAGDGAWSVDLLPTKDGRWFWFVTDMAEASKSFHWEGCEHAASFASRRA